MENRNIVLWGAVGITMAMFTLQKSIQHCVFYRQPSTRCSTVFSHWQKQLKIMASCVPNTKCHIWTATMPRPLRVKQSQTDQYAFYLVFYVAIWLPVCSSFFFVCVEWMSPKCNLLMLTLPFLALGENVICSPVCYSHTYSTMSRCSRPCWLTVLLTQNRKGKLLRYQLNPVFFHAQICSACWEEMAPHGSFFCFLMPDIEAKDLKLPWGYFFSCFASYASRPLTIVKMYFYTSSPHTEEQCQAFNIEIAVSCTGISHCVSKVNRHGNERTVNLVFIHQLGTQTNWDGLPGVISCWKASLCTVCVRVCVCTVYVFTYILCMCSRMYCVCVYIHTFY